MLKSVIVTNPAGESLLLELEHPENSSGFSVLGIDGLGPGLSVINISESATMDGGMFSSARKATRNIVLALKFEPWCLPFPCPSVETLRQLTYRFFQTQKWVNLIFVSDNRVCQIDGIVESNDPNIFSSASITQISILCPDPKFYSLDSNKTSFGTSDPNFEFPFSNESLTLNMLQTGLVNKAHEQNIFYEGDADIGMKITIHTDGDSVEALTNVSIYNQTLGQMMTLKISAILSLTGKEFGREGRVEDIIISSRQGSKYVKLLRSGVYTNIIPILDKDSDWLTLTKGDNTIIFTGNSEVSDLTFIVENKVAYEGV